MLCVRVVNLRLLPPLAVAALVAGVSIGVAADVRAQASQAKPACEELRGATVADVLQGKLPGVNVTVLGGAASGGGSIRVRGTNTIQSNNPLIYVDNVRVSPYLSTGPRAMHSVPLFDFVDVMQIDRIEVLRGPAATIQYGDGAAAGVILIYTKRGRDRSASECNATSETP
jgi:outer membrane receptor for ferrienterochelin and colicin